MLIDNLCHACVCRFYVMYTYERKKAYHPCHLTEEYEPHDTEMLLFLTSCASHWCGIQPSRHQLKCHVVSRAPAVRSVPQCYLAHSARSVNGIFWFFGSSDWRVNYRNLKIKSEFSESFSNDRVVTVCKIFHFWGFNQIWVWWIPAKNGPETSVIGGKCLDFDLVLVEIG